jgi:hypothetical protein
VPLPPLCQPYAASSRLLFGARATLSSSGDVLPSDFLAAEVDSVSLWRRVLSAPTLTSLMSQPPSGSEQGLVALWLLDEGVGQVAGSSVRSAGRTRDAITVAGNLMYTGFMPGGLLARLAPSTTCCKRAFGSVVVCRLCLGIDPCPPPPLPLFLQPWV